MCKRPALFEKTLHLVPKAVVLGIGCKRGTERAVIQELVEEVLEVNGYFQGKYL